MRQVPPEAYGFNSTVASVRKSLQRLGSDYLDLVLLHDVYCGGEEDSLCPPGRDGDPLAAGPVLATSIPRRTIHTGSVLQMSCRTAGTP